MDIYEIKKHITKLHSNTSINESSVLIPLINIDNELHLLFEKRALHLNSQPGEICFPGGRNEHGETPSYSALRETMEELNLKKENVEILNNLGSFNTIFNLKINIFLGTIKGIKFENINFNKSEVENLFTIPLKFLLNSNEKIYNFNILLTSSEDFPISKVENGEIYNKREKLYEVISYEYKDKIIWGLTGKILKKFLDNVKGLS